MVLFCIPIALYVSDVTKTRPPARLRQKNSWPSCGMAADTNVSLVSSTSSLQNVAILTKIDGVPGSKFESDAENYTVEQLKRWLKCRGIKVAREAIL